jgi:UDP-N-acetylenolpyruvoylglucosamine reductase
VSAPANGLVERGVLLSKLTTIGTGGPATAYAAPRSLAELEQVLRFARAHELEVVVVGLGSNVLAADAGVDALVVRLTGELARVDVVRGERLVAGGGATNAVCLHAARRAGLGGFEFACAIPGTAGGGVRMNAGAYGRDWSEVLLRALVVSADGSEWRSPAELGLAYRTSALRPGEVVATVEYRLEARPESEIRATVAQLVEARKATQPTSKRTFGSVFKNPPGELGAGKLLELCGLKGHRQGGAVISPKHANFIENAGGATSADCVALMREARRRARERFGVELEQEVVFLGDLSLEG